MKCNVCHYIIQGSFRPMLATWALIPYCHVPMPPTGEEDAITMALTMRAKSPWTCTWIKLHKQNAGGNALGKTCTNAIVHHTQLSLFIMHSGINMHSHKHSLNMFITFINIIYGCRSKNGKDHLSYKNSLRNQLRRCNVPPNHRPACSLIS